MIYLLGVLTLSSCVEDEGNNTMNAINEARIEGIEGQYYKVTNLETLEIPVKVTGTLSGDKSDQFTYEWFLCNNALNESYHRHQTISREKDLSFPVNVVPGEYRLFFRVKDKTTLTR